MSSWPSWESISSQGRPSILLEGKDKVNLERTITNFISKGEGHSRTNRAVSRCGQHTSADRSCANGGVWTSRQPRATRARQCWGRSERPSSRPGVREGPPRCCCGGRKSPRTTNRGMLGTFPAPPRKCPLSSPTGSPSEEAAGSQPECQPAAAPPPPHQADARAPGSGSALRAARRIAGRSAAAWVRPRRIQGARVLGNWGPELTTPGLGIVLWLSCRAKLCPAHRTVFC